MKLLIAAGCAVIATLAVVFYQSNRHPKDPHIEWKRYAVEKETKVRPARFEDMKYHAVELRAPASKEN